MLRSVSDFLAAPSTCGLLDASINCARCLTQKRGMRRVLKPPPWIPQKDENVKEFLEPETESLLQQVIEHERRGIRPSWVTVESPLRDLPWQQEEGAARQWTLNSRRVGLIARKIGMFPQWLNDGTRVLCTLLEFPENHVVSAVDPETWYRQSVVGKRKAFTNTGTFWKVTVGAVNGNPLKCTHQYRSLFERQGLPVKDYIRSFLVTEDAVVAPGTPLHVRHFLVGQYVTVTGKTIDWGFQGGMHRWGMKGMPALGTTKSHRRIGAVGSTGDARIWPGKRMPGHMGYEWRTTSGLEVLRINPKKQVMYIKGSVPGEIGEILLVKDCIQPEKRVLSPPFPTFCPSLEMDSKDLGVEKVEQPAIVPDVPENEELFGAKLFRFASPSVVFTAQHETKVAGRDRTRAKIAKVKK